MTARLPIAMVTVALVSLAADPLSAAAQSQAPACRFLCELEWKVEPTITIENLGNRHRVVTAEGVTERAARERVFETVLALDNLATGTPRRGDVFPDGTRFLDDASRWSFSFVFVMPVAPF